MAIEIVPEWMVNLDEEDVAFIKKFLLASGSLKEIAKQYGCLLYTSDAADEEFAV